MQTSAIPDGYLAHLSLLCKCGFALDLYEGQLGVCGNRRCEEYGKFFSVTVNVQEIAVDAKQPS